MFKAALALCTMYLARGGAFVCPYGSDWSSVVADMHDGDQKALNVDGSSLTITPNNNTETWTISSTIDQESCSAMVDFDVPGKPNPPPVPLLATFASVSTATDAAHCTNAATCTYWLRFTDPSGILASPSYPLNVWVSI